MADTYISLVREDYSADNFVKLKVIDNLDGTHSLDTNTTVNVGSITIGGIKVEDADSTLQANVKIASGALATTTKALVVQQVSQDGTGIMGTKITNGTDTVEIANISGEKALKVTSLGGATETTLSTVSTTLSNISGYVDQLEGYTDGIEGALTTLNAKDFATQTTLAAVSTSLSNIYAAVDQLEGYTDGIEGTLSTISTTLSGTLAVDQVDTASLDYDTGAGTVNQTILGIALPGTGGPVAGGTSTNPVRTDPTGATTQPVSGTVTSNIGTTNGLALDATLTSGTQKAIVRGGAKGTTVAADVTSSSIDADHQALDVFIKGGSSAGTEYTEGDVDSTITGQALLWEDTSDTLRAVSAVKPLPVNIVSGSSSGTEYTEGDVDATITGQAILWEDTSDTLRAVSAGKPLPVTATLPANSGVDIGDVTVNNAAGAAAVNIQDGGNSITVDGTFFQATQPVSGTVTANAGTGPWPVTDNGGSLTIDGSVTSVAQPGVDIGDVTVNNAAGAAAVNIQDGGNSITVDGTLASSEAKAEDDPALSGDSGIPILAVRNDAAVSKTSIDGDYSMLAVDAAGRVGIADLGGSISIDDNGSSITVDGTVTSNIGTTNGLALDATLTGGTQKAIVRGGAKGTTTAADVTSTNVSADRQALDVYIQGGASSGTEYTEGDIDATITGQALLWEDTSDTLRAVSAAKPLPISGTVTANAGTGPWPVTDNGGSLTVDGTVTATLPANSGVDIGDVTVNNAAGAAAVNIQDGGNSITVDGTVTANAGTGPWPITDNGGSITDDGTVTAAEPQPASSSVSRVAVTAANITLASSNTSRKGLVVYNESGTVYIKLGTTASSTDYTYRLTSDQSLELPFPIYTGRIDAIRSAAGTSQNQVTELT